jgi:hypothetical protein
MRFSREIVNKIMKEKYTRREVLKFLGAAAGGILIPKFLISCSPPLSKTQTPCEEAGPECIEQVPLTSLIPNNLPEMLAKPLTFDNDQVFLPESQQVEILNLRKFMEEKEKDRKLNVLEAPDTTDGVPFVSHVSFEVDGNKIDPDSTFDIHLSKSEIQALKKAKEKKEYDLDAANALGILFHEGLHSLQCMKTLEYLQMPGKEAFLDELNSAYIEATVKAWCREPEAYLNDMQTNTYGDYTVSLNQQSLVVLEHKLGLDKGDHAGGKFLLAQDLRWQALSIAFLESGLLFTCMTKVYGEVIPDSDIQKMAEFSKPTSTISIDEMQNWISGLNLSEYTDENKQIIRDTMLWALIGLRDARQSNAALDSIQADLIHSHPDEINQLKKLLLEKEQANEQLYNLPAFKFTDHFKASLPLGTLVSQLTRHLRQFHCKNGMV